MTYFEIYTLQNISNSKLGNKFFSYFTIKRTNKTNKDKPSMYDPLLKNR